MTYGPMQLVVLGFAEARIPYVLIDQLRRQRELGVVRIVDAHFVAKDDQGEMTSIEASDLEPDEAILLGTIAGALFGYGAGGDEGVEIGAELGRLAAESGDFGLDAGDFDEIADLIPAGSSALFLVLEHLWATGLKEAVQNADGIVIANGWITPETLIAAGAEFAAEAAIS